MNRPLHRHKVFLAEFDRSLHRLERHFVRQIVKPIFGPPQHFQNERQSYNVAVGLTEGAFQLMVLETLVLPASILLEQNDEWAVQRARYMTLESVAPLSDDPLVSLPAVPAR